ncbi:MAG: N-acetylneuraminate synthase family protein [Treponema sp.]|nr:N-acetylneuraminate synthase family protein [Treponema sp.]
MKNEKFLIDNREYSPQRLLIIAELGSSHGSDPLKAAELIEAAAEAGADCVKFQMIYADEILHPNTGEVALPGGNIKLYDRFKALETEPDFFAEMKERVEKRGLIFLCTPFGLKSARELRKLGPKCLKIASPELNFTALLKEIASYALPTLLSSGVSSLADIEEALSTLAAKPEAGHEASPVCLLHCVTAYPAPEKDYNLRVLQSLRAVFGLPVGLSDHSLDPCLVPVLGAAMGAAVVEKHFCLSRNDPGLDDPIALPPDSFARMVLALRQAEKATAEESIEAMCREYGRETVESVLGDGIKRLAPSEKANYGRTNRSIHALRDIAQGEIIEPDMFASLRTEKLLRPGLPPSWEEKLTGRRARAVIAAGQGIRFEDV